MRYLAYTLLLVNIVFFILSSGAKPPQEVRLHQDGIPLDADQLVLLSERLADVSSNLASISPTGYSTQIDCHAIGPLTQEKADDVYEKLIEQKYAASIRNSEVEEAAGYRVFLPAMSLVEAKRTMADLKVRGMNDYFMGKQNDISLGVFSSRAKAQTQQQKVEQYGYRVEIENRYRIRTAYWLDVEESESSLLQSEIWAEMQSIHPDLRSSLVRCE